MEVEEEKEEEEERGGGRGGGGVRWRWRKRRRRRRREEEEREGGRRRKGEGGGGRKRGERVACQKLESMDNTNFQSPKSQKPFLLHMAHQSHGPLSGWWGADLLLQLAPPPQCQDEDHCTHQEDHKHHNRNHNASNCSTTQACMCVCVMCDRQFIEKCACVCWEGAQGKGG